MKRLTILLLGVALVLYIKTVCFAAPAWEISAGPWESGGSFDYLLYYPYSPQLESLVSFPQNQTLILVKLRHNLNEGRYFIELQYGGSIPGYKGRGSDSDWTVYGEDTLTYYGEMDAVGGIKKLAIEGGTVLAENDIRTTVLFGGWSRQETSNELKNVIYHLVDGMDVGNQTQPDNGSRFDGVLSGCHFGIANQFVISPRLTLNMKAAVAVLGIKAYGHWANHDPAWDWVDTGSTLGFAVDSGIEWAFNPNLSANIGYDYYYANFSGCEEILNGVPLEEAVTLIYRRAGVMLGLKYQF